MYACLYVEFFTIFHTISKSQTKTMNKKMTHITRATAFCMRMVIQAQFFHHSDWIIKLKIFVNPNQSLAWTLMILKNLFEFQKKCWRIFVKCKYFSAKFIMKDYQFLHDKEKRKKWSTRKIMNNHNLHFILGKRFKIRAISLLLSVIHFRW